MSLLMCDHVHGGFLLCISIGICFHINENILPAVSQAAFPKPNWMSFPPTVSPAAACCTCVLALPSLVGVLRVAAPVGLIHPEWERDRLHQPRVEEAGPEKVRLLPGAARHRLFPSCCPASTRGKLRASHLLPIWRPVLQGRWPPPPHAAGLTLQQVPLASELFFLGLPPRPQRSPVPWSLQRTFCSF